MSGGHGAVPNYFISSVSFCVIIIFCSADQWHTVLLEISHVGATDGSSSPPSFNYIAELTELILEKHLNTDHCLRIFEV